jgi:transcriptional regulator
MYNFAHFKENDRQAILTFIQEHPFAFVTGSFANGKQVATQIPLLIKEKNGEFFLQGHMMRKTDHHKAFIENPNMLIVFTGPNCYVSASWYSNPQMGSTWNYMSVHVAGEVRFLSDDELIELMRAFTLKHENGNTASLTIYDNLSAEYLSKMMPGIVGFELKINKLENVFKLSQNRDEKSYANIISKLKEQGGSSALVAEEMIKRKGSLFAK